jgi:hypothetical protein
MLDGPRSGPCPFQHHNEMHMYVHSPCAAPLCPLHDNSVEISSRDLKGKSEQTEEETW